MCALSSSAAAAGRGPNAHTPDKVYSWYCKHTGSHTPPVLDAPLRFIENYPCYYRNTQVTDDDMVIYLTFDLGYENGNTERILEAMDAHGATGAFFVLDHVITENTDLIRRIAESGNLVCNHTAKHHDMSAVKEKETFAAELSALEEIYRNTLGFEMAKIYRPPEGKFTEQNLIWATELGYVTAFWSFAYADWDNGNQPDTERAFQKIIDNTHNGEILLLHPTSATNAAIMDRLLGEWEKMGYRFGSLTELKGSDPLS